MRVNRRAAIAGSVLALGGFVAGLTPAQAAGEPAEVRASDGTTSYYLTFKKNTNTNSTLRLIKQRVTEQGTSRVTLAQYRAGSGHTTNECEKNKGWLPNGTYTIGKYHTQYDGSVIKGYAFSLNDKTCKNGVTKRTELFIHSKMKKDGTSQWTGDNNYKSEGCIKLKPADIKDLYKQAKKVGFPKTLKVS
ncbi:L,D-transpeptidase family protein [Streptomyces sp. NPDC057623]|uniref:L,D-transpeptidase family protein n=1 Tax=Streptomyces sp. NPDC057623 TaxID=3346187 RepID=UPI00367AA7D3